jgi:hypothetical protein
MTTKPPPVPPANRSDKGPGEGPKARAAQIAESSRAPDRDDPDRQGQTGNTKINTTHQGLQQDR